MSRRWGIALAGLLACGPGEHAPSPAFERARTQGSAAEREWRTYLGDRGVSHHSPLDQINRDTVTGLELAWSYDAGEASEYDVSQIQFNPLVVK
ncbi:MAG: hypothetical protein GY937_14000, partial [bacterium]|nr:hypothetical protein [bacterium]